MRNFSLAPSFVFAALTCGFTGPVLASLVSPQVSGDLIFEEVDGVVAVEGEHFYRQTLTETRAWQILSKTEQPDAADASGGAYIEILPDTRRTHDDPLVPGENFSNTPGVMAVVHYRVFFHNPGRYYVWVRARPSGTEDNGVHVGLNGEWPESGQRWQTTGSGAWAWASRQRTEAVHVGEPWLLYLDIPTAGAHEIQFSMREDGFEMDKFVLASGRDFMPEGEGPPPRLKSESLSVPAAASPTP